VAVLPEDPSDLVAGKNYGSEGTAQRYLCALLISGPEYGYNKSWPLSERGTKFVTLLYAQKFGGPPAGAPRFWNEMNLRATAADDEHAVDYAFTWPDVHFLVELKTLGGSHRPGQLAEYLVRARHHNPGPAIDLLYLTQPMSAASPSDIPERCRYAHLTWSDALELADSVWGDSEDAKEMRCLALLREHLQREGALADQPVRPTTRRQAVVPDELPVEWQHVLAGAVEAARQSARGSRMAIDVPLDLASAGAFPSQLENVRRLLESRIGSDLDLAGVKVWQWTSQTGGRAYTEAGERMGLELRLTPPKA